MFAEGHECHLLRFEVPAAEKEKNWREVPMK